VRCAGKLTELGAVDLVALVVEAAVLHVRDELHAVVTEDTNTERTPRRSYRTSFSRSARPKSRSTVRAVSRLEISNGVPMLYT
jgi:hypothetical protein